jgi:selenide,water dikinase
MLPGLLAGHYSFEDAHIELQRLCQWAGVRFIVDRVIGLDPQRRCLQCSDRGEVFYDLLSIDIGSQPELDSVPGAREFAVPVKPVAGLWARWQELADDANLADARIAVVGGGAGSVELVLAIAHRLAARRPRWLCTAAHRKCFRGTAAVCGEPSSASSRRWA